MKTVHPNYIKASHILFLSMLLSILGFVISSFFTGLGAVQVITLVFSVLVTSALILFIRKGHSWVKYFFLVTFLLTLVLFGASIPFLGEATAAFSGIELAVKAIFGALTWGLQLLTMILLFKAGKEPVSEDEYDQRAALPGRMP